MLSIYYILCPSLFLSNCLAFYNAYTEEKRLKRELEIYKTRDIWSSFHFIVRRWISRCSSKQLESTQDMFHPPSNGILMCKVVQSVSVLSKTLLNNILSINVPDTVIGQGTGASFPCYKRLQFCTFKVFAWAQCLINSKRWAQLVIEWENLFQVSMYVCMYV